MEFSGSGITRTFKAIAKGEKAHEARFGRLLGPVVDGTVFPRGARACGRGLGCGHIRAGTLAPGTCPVRLGPRAFFQPVGEIC